MKKLAGLVVILAALILGSYYGMGIITERTLKKNIAVIDQSNGVFVEIEQYHRGWYRSTALLNWRMEVPARITKNQEGVEITIPAQEYKMQVPLDIYHGPIMFVDFKPMFGMGYARSHVALVQPYADQFAKAYTAASIAPVLNLNIFVNYLNYSMVDVNMPGFKLVSKEGNNQLEWLGMTSDINISSNHNQVNGRVTIDGINFQKEKVSVALGKVVSNFDLHRTALDLYLGDGNILFSSLMIMQDDKKNLDMQQLDVQSTSNIQDGLLGTHLKMTLGKLLSADKVYGPALLDVSLNNLDAEAFAKINRQANELQEADKQKALFMLMPELLKLFGKGALLKISELSVTMPEGIIKGNLLVSLPAEGVDNPFQLIQKLKGQGKLVFSEAVLKQLMNDTVKQSLQKQADLQTATLDSASGGTSTPAPETVVPVSTATTSAPETVVPVSTATPAPEAVVPDSMPTPASEAVAPAQKVDDPEVIAKQANEKLANMVQSGLLSLQGSDYVIEFKLAEGKLEVNGKPFNSAMMGF